MSTVCRVLSRGVLGGKLLPPPKLWRLPEIFAVLGMILPLGLHQNQYRKTQIPNLSWVACLQTPLNTTLHTTSSSNSKSYIEPRLAARTSLFVLDFVLQGWVLQCILTTTNLARLGASTAVPKCGSIKSLTKFNSVTKEILKTPINPRTVRMRTRLPLSC